MKTLLSIVLIYAVIAPAPCSPVCPVPAVTIAGRWKVEFALSDSRSHTIQFDADDSGKGTLLLLDVTSNLVPPAEPTNAVWSQDDSQISFSGNIEFPIGNVGRDAGMLKFRGTLSSPQAFSGDVVFISISPDQPKKTGTFSAMRIEVSTVQLLTLNSGEKVKRGQSVRIEWIIQGSLSPIGQQLFLSTDDGDHFSPLSPLLDGDARSFVWEISWAIGKTKKALLRIRATDVDGKSAEDISDTTFRIK